MTSKRWMAAWGLCVALLAGGCAAGPASPGPGTSTSPGVSSPRSPFAWPNSALSPSGDLIYTGLVYEDQELVLSFSAIAGGVAQQAAWVSRQTGTPSLVADPEWGWTEPSGRRDGLMAFAQVVLTDGRLLEYGYAVDGAASVIIEQADRRYDAHTASWSANRKVVAFWSLRQGSPTHHQSPDAARPTVTLTDAGGRVIDRRLLQEPPQRQDG